MSNQPSKEPDFETPPEPVTGLPGFVRRYQQQLWGFFGWYFIHIMLWLLFGARIGDDLGVTGEGWYIINGLIFLANLFVLIVLAIIRATRKIALGILLAIGLNFAISLVMGLEYNGWCFIPFVFPS